MSVQRTLSILSLLGASVFAIHCGSSTSDAEKNGVTSDAGTDATTEGGSDAKVDTGAESGGECGPAPGGLDCFDPCSDGFSAPFCVDGSWTCDPSPIECPDSGTRCAPDGNAVPVSCDPFPENTACDPLGVWSLSYATDYPGMCAQPAIGSVSIERGSDGIVRVAFGSTASATLTLDGCELSAVSLHDWTNPSENGTVFHSLTLSFAGDAADTASGQLTYSETGLCSGSGTTNATATKLTN
jgi:hypothetical protein